MKSKMGWSLSNLVALVRLNIFTHRNLWVWLDKPYDTPTDQPEELERVQMELQLC